MPHDVFISHSSLDKPVADAVCAALKNTAIRCWIAPRDVQPGRSFAGEITRAIQRSKVMVLIFSAHSNTSASWSEHQRRFCRSQAVRRWLPLPQLQSSCTTLTVYYKEFYCPTELAGLLPTAVSKDVRQE